MTDLKEIISLPVEKELHTCPSCGYTLGFHVSFVGTGLNRENPVRSSREVFRVILICPECGARYDGGWRVTLNEFESPAGRAPAPSSSCVPHGSPAACLPRHDIHFPK